LLACALTEGIRVKKSAIFFILFFKFILLLESFKYVFSLCLYGDDKMVNVLISVPEDVKELMDKFKGIDWSRVARVAISKKAKQLAFLKYFASESELTEQDALELGEKVNKEVSKKYRELV